ncbi:MAG: glycosyltransferase family 4 protein [Bryobacteraceae bacterium]|nr:glycosyltransferase family 4 protein [Bryobacteraceae bacterium]
MKILLLDSGKQMRGGQWQVLRLAGGLSSAGHDVTLLALQEGALFQLAKREGIRVEPLRAGRLWSAGRRNDIVHAHDARSHTLAVLAHLRPVVVSRRVAFAIGTGILSKLKYRRVDRYIAISGFVRERLLDAGIASQRIRVVYDGMPCPASRPLPEPVRIVAPATSDPMKGSDLLREAAKLAGVEVWFSEHLPADLKTASMFAYITRQEGLGSAVLLAMAHGVPVIASGVGGLLEVVQPERSGLLVDNEPMAIAGAMRRLLSDASLRALLAEGGYRRVREHFSEEQMINGTLEVYDDVLSGKYGEPAT